MRRIRVYETGEPEVMKIEEASDPQAGSGEVVVQVKAIGVNPVDTYLRSGKQGYTPKCPYTPGIDAAGIVESVGEDVSTAGVGDRVYCAGTLSGAYAEKAVCSASQVHLLPTSVSFSQGAAIGIPYGTAYRALFQRAQAIAGETVLVHGASGGVGIAAVQLARAAGLQVIGTAGSEQTRQLVREQGAHYMLDHHLPEHFEQILELTKRQGVNVILEMLANVNLGNDLPILARDGRVVVIGSRGDVQINPRNLMKRDANIMGMRLFNASPLERSSIYAALTAGLNNGTLRPVIGRELTLSAAAQAHHLVIEASAYGKIILIP